MSAAVTTIVPVGSVRARRRTIAIAIAGAARYVSRGAREPHSSSRWRRCLGLQALAGRAPARTFVSGRAEPGSRRTRRRLAHYRTGCEGRISHLKRGYGLRRSRLKGYQGQRIWTGWAILDYNLDTSPSTPPDRSGCPPRGTIRSRKHGATEADCLTLRLSGESS